MINYFNKEKIREIATKKVKISAFVGSVVLMGMLLTGCDNVREFTEEELEGISYIAISSEEELDFISSEGIIYRQSDLDAIIVNKDINPDSNNMVSACGVFNGQLINGEVTVCNELNEQSVVLIEVNVPYSNNGELNVRNRSNEIIDKLPDGAVVVATGIRKDVNIDEPTGDFYELTGGESYITVGGFGGGKPYTPKIYELPHLEKSNDIDNTGNGYSGR